MGQFKPVVKMMTDEPSVILKLKKGGKVAHKAMGGYMPMASTQGAAMPAGMPMGMPARGGMAPAVGPMKPPLAMRRRAMNPTMMKKGGKADEMHEDAAQDRAMIKKAMAGKKFASGGEIDKDATKTTIKGNAGKYAKTKMDTAKKDSAHGTGVVKMGKPGGYAMGGSIEGNEKAYENTKMHTAKRDTASGTGGVKMGNGGGYAKGGNVDWENRPADTAKPGKVNTTTGGVKNGNGGGYKMGGSTKKAYATGGTVDTGKPVAMPRKPVSRPIANSLQSGTFKKGGKVYHHANGGSQKSDYDSDEFHDEYEDSDGRIRTRVKKDEPAFAARKLYAQTYAKHGKTIGQSKGAETKAYETVGKKHGEEVLKKLQAFHKKNENGYARGGNVKRYEDGDRVIASETARMNAEKEAERKENEGMRDMILGAPRRALDSVKGMFGSTPKPAGSITKTEKSVTVAPGRKRGGSAMC